MKTPENGSAEPFFCCRNAENTVISAFLQLIRSSAGGKMVIEYNGGRGICRKRSGRKIGSEEENRAGAQRRLEA